MNISQTLFSLNGRIGQQDFWVGVLIIFGGNIVGSVLGPLVIITWPLFVWVGIAVYGKRLHDAGRTAWIHLIPWVISLVTVVLGTVMIIGGAVSAGLMSNDGELSREQIMALLTGGGGGLAVMSLSTLVWLAYTIWVGVLKGDPQTNVYGAPPTDTITPAASAASTGDGPREG